MSKIFDISAKLTNERPKLKLADDKIYEIDDRKNTILKMEQALQGNDLESVESIDNLIKMLLGEEAAKEINEMDLNIASYKAIMIAVMAAVTGEDYEVVEARFLKQTSL